MAVTPLLRWADHFVRTPAVNYRRHNILILLNHYRIVCHNLLNNRHNISRDLNMNVSGTVTNRNSHVINLVQRRPVHLELHVHVSGTMTNRYNNLR